MDDQTPNRPNFKLNVHSILLALLSMLVVVAIIIEGSKFFSWIIPQTFLTAINFIAIVTCIAIVVLLFFVIVVDLVQSFEKIPTRSAGDNDKHKNRIKIQVRSILLTMISILFAMALIISMALTFSWMLPQTLFAAISFAAFITFIATMILVPLMVMKDLTQSFSKEPVLSALRMGSLLAVVGLLTLTAWLVIYHNRANTVIANGIIQEKNIEFTSIFNNLPSEEGYALALPPYIYPDQLTCNAPTMALDNITDLDMTRSILDYWLGGEVYTTLIAFNSQKALDTTSVKSELLCTIPRPIACVKISESVLIFNKAQNCYNIEKKPR